MSALAAAGDEPLMLHDPRHTAMPLAVSSRVTLEAIQRTLDHASAVMTLDMYTDLFNDAL